MAEKGSASAVISHWYNLFENFQTPPMSFYTAVEAAIKRREIPEVSISRVDWKEGGLLSARREYLRVSRGKLAFDICGAPFGTGFFFSWWLAEVPPPYGVLYAAVIVFIGFSLLGTSVQTFGFFGGLSVAAIAFPFLVWFLGYVVREGHWGPGAEDALLAIPLFGPLYERLFKPITYYKMDTALMFQSAAHAAVMEVIDGMTQEKGIRTLSEIERKPIIREFGRR